MARETFITYHRDEEALTIIGHLMDSHNKHAHTLNDISFKLQELEETVTESSTTNLSALGGGFTGYDEYYLTNTINSSSDAIITTWTQMVKIGTGMSLSTGIFTFPETGYWLVCTRGYMRSGLNAAGTLGLDTYYSANNFSSETLYDRQGGTVDNG
jgi:hypothetical protein